MNRLRAEAESQTNLTERGQQVASALESVLLRVGYTFKVGEQIPQSVINDALSVIGIRFSDARSFITLDLLLYIVRMNVPRLTVTFHSQRGDASYYEVGLL